MSNKTIFSFLVLVLVFLSAAFVVSQREEPTSKLYINLTAGLSFEYPIDWGIKNIEEDNFNIGIYPPDYGIGNSSYVRVINSSPRDAEGNFQNNLPIEEQLHTISCETEAAWYKKNPLYIPTQPTCKEFVNKNGVKYIRHVYNFSRSTDRPDDGYAIDTSMPTGKYIVSFETMSTEDQGAPIFSLIDQIVESVELK